MTDILIRNVDEALLARIDERARLSNQSRQEFLMKLLDDAVGGHVSSEVCIGFVELHQSELGREYVCQSCETELGERSLWLGYTGDLRPFGPVCADCAVTE